MKKKTIILGYSLDSCLFARKIAETNDVEFLKTGVLGYPYDDVGDYVYEDGIRLISNVLGENIETNALINSTYIYIPYNEIKFFNTKNGLISYPFNKLSFELDKEYIEVEKCCCALQKFYKENNSNNFINNFKSHFPKWLYESVIKYIGINKWGGIKQSKLTKKCLYKEIDISNINKKGGGVIYKPQMTYEEICNRLLHHKRIKVVDFDVLTANELIKHRFKKNVDIIIMDNRIDKIIGFHHGVLDRIDVIIDDIKEKNLIEFVDIDYGIVFTPKSNYWCVIKTRESTKKIYSKISTVDSFNQSILIPTTSNKKMICEYRDLVNLYSGKQLNLKNYVKTVLI